MRELAVFLNDRRVGMLREGNDLWSFEYDPAWSGAPDAFDLSPRLARTRGLHEDGGSDRPVQWYFDNLLPEEEMRLLLSREAAIRGEDAFALLAFLGAESAGSLVLRAPGVTAPAEGGLRALTDDALCARIRQLPRVSLSHEAPKRMSIAGAQPKLLVVLHDGELHEPVGSEPSTHILKPDHPHTDFPASVVNEYVIMRLAARLRLDVPSVARRYTPEPVYIVERFDRYRDESGRTCRRHIIDACQLLNQPRLFKYTSATLDTLARIVTLCRNRAQTRQRLFTWLVFNVLVANHDNHLKNLSFVVDHDGIALAPAYDLLSTGAYHTKALADERADWPDLQLAVTLPGARTFGEVTRDAVCRAGEALGWPRRLAERELDRLVSALPGALDALVGEVTEQAVSAGPAGRPFVNRDGRLLRVIQKVVVPDMLRRVA